MSRASPLTPFTFPQNFQSTSQPVTFINGSTLVAGVDGSRTRRW